MVTLKSSKIESGGSECQRMKKLYICVLMAIKPAASSNEQIHTKWHVCTAVSHEEALGEAMVIAEEGWPRGKWVNHSVSAEEFPAELIEKIRLLYSLSAIQS